MLKRLLDLLIPSRCAACGARGEPCCTRCAEVWGGAREVVRGPTAGLVRVFALARYRGAGRRLLIAYKERGRRDLAPSLGRALAEALLVLPLKVDPPGRAGASAGPGAVPDQPGSAPPSPAHPTSALRPAPACALGGPSPVSAHPSAPKPAPARASSGPPPAPAHHNSAPHPASAQATTPTPPAPPARAICLVPAPSRPSAARVRGGPHVERLANEAATTLATRGIKVAVAPALELAGTARDAVGLTREQRKANLAGRLKFREAGRPPPGFAVVVLDDVITTGATAAACTRALTAEGFTVSAVLTLLAAG